MSDWQLPWPKVKQGKVREIYAVDEERLLIVASDRISAFDVVLPTPIPRKGEVLTRLSRFWFRKFSHLIDHHLLEDESIWQALPSELARELAPRSMLVKKAKVLPIEAIVRGYLVGSGWKEYQQTGAVCGIRLPKGLRLAEKLPEPIFTPSTKAEAGHDENISFAEMVKRIGRKLAERVRAISLRIYREAAAYAEERGLILADTKFEFGLDDEGRLLWVDEALTPDSSRFWPKDAWRPGENPPSFDKQYVRDWLERSGWDKTPPAPQLPPEVVQKTAEKYEEALYRLTGERLE